MKRKPFWIRVAYRSLLALPVTLLALIVIAAVTGEPIPDSALGFLVGLVFFGIVFGAGLRLWRRMLIPTAIISVSIAATTLLTGIGLQHPESFYDFVAALAAIFLPGITFVACVYAIYLRRKGRLDAEPSRRQRLILRGVGTIGAALVLASAGLTLAQRPIEVSADEPVKLVAVADRFFPDEFRVTEGDRVTFVIRNDDTYAHDFSVDEFHVGPEHLGPLSERRITFDAVTDEPARELKLFCAISGHEAMVGKIYVDRLP